MCPAEEKGSLKHQSKPHWAPSISTGICIFSMPCLSIGCVTGMIWGTGKIWGTGNTLKKNCTVINPHFLLLIERNINWQWGTLSAMIVKTINMLAMQRRKNLQSPFYQSMLNIPKMTSLRISDNRLAMCFGLLRPQTVLIVFMA